MAGAVIPVLARMAPLIAQGARTGIPQALRWLGGLTSLAGVDMLIDWARGTFTRENIRNWLKKAGKEAVKGALDAAIDYVRGNVGIGFVLAAFGKAVEADWNIKRTYWDADINVPVPDALPALADAIQDLLALLVSADAIGNFDVGSDIAESLFDQIFSSMVGDTFKKLWDIYTPTESLDDDEIRDIISAGAVKTGPELALSALLLGLDTWSAMAELLTGFYQGLDVQWRYYQRLLEEQMDRTRYGYRIGLYELALREVAGDVIDSGYWYMQALDPMMDTAARMVRTYFEAHMQVVAGALDPGLLDAYEDALVEWLTQLKNVVEDADLRNPEFYVRVSELMGYIRAGLYNEYKRLKEAYMKHIEDGVKEAVNAVKSAYELTKMVRTALPTPITSRPDKGGENGSGDGGGDAPLIG